MIDKTTPVEHKIPIEMNNNTNQNLDRQTETVYDLEINNMLKY